jgi:hypothetical protein
MHKSPFQFTEAVQHENLEISFLLGPSTLPDYLTLAEGCRLNIVEVLETGTVGSLVVHNHSPKKPLFIQLGELLKGGLQDRTIATDLILDPGERYDELSVYCVEHARWSKRREEDQKRFVSTQDFVVTKPLRSSLEKERTKAPFGLQLTPSRIKWPDSYLVSSDLRFRHQVFSSAWKTLGCVKVFSNGPWPSADNAGPTRKPSALRSLLISVWKGSIGMGMPVCCGASGQGFCGQRFSKRYWKGLRSLPNRLGSTKNALGTSLPNWRKLSQANAAHLPKLLMSDGSLPPVA